MISALLLLLILACIYTSVDNLHAPGPLKWSLIFILSLSCLLLISLLTLSINIYSPFPVSSHLIIAAASVLITSTILCSGSSRSVPVSRVFKWPLVLIRALKIDYSPVDNMSIGQIAKATNIFTYIYFTALILVTIPAEVTNGDAQTYNLSRVASVILSKDIFIKQTSVPTQAFHAFAHDYLYVPDIAFGNIVGLGLLSIIELSFMLIIVDQLLLEVSGWSLNDRTAKVTQIRCIARLLYLSMPPLFYQANNVKNDLVMAPLCFSLFIIGYHLILMFQHRNRSSIRWLSQARSVLIIAFALCCLLILQSKGYGICCIIAILLSFLTWTLKPTDLQKKSITRLLHTIRISRYKHVLNPMRIILSSLTVYVFLFEYNKKIFWHDSYRLFAELHGPKLFDVIRYLPSTFLKITTEMILNIPLPFQTDIFKHLVIYNKSPNLLDHSYIFGGVINQDISWPGVVFNACLLITLLSALCKAIYLSFRLGAIPAFIHISNKGISLESASFLAGGLIFLCLTSFLYWQPASSRFYLPAFCLMVPALSTTLNRLVFSQANPSHQ